MKNKALSKVASITILILFYTSAMSHGPVKKTSSKKYYTEIKYEYLMDRIIIPIEIENNTYKFVFDTGVPSIISDKLLDIITIKDKKRLELRASKNTSVSLDLVTIPEIKIGGVPFKNTTSLIDDGVLGSLIDCLGVDGSIGSSMFDRSIIQILPRRNLIRLTNRKKKIPMEKQDATKLMLSGNQAQPYFWIELHGNTKVKDKIFFDTGMSDLYNLSQRRLSEFEQKNIINRPVSQNNANKISLPKITLAEALFKNVPVKSSNTETSRMGVTLMKYGNVTLNFRNKKFYFDPFDKEIDLGNQANVVSSTKTSSCR